LYVDAPCELIVFDASQAELPRLQTCAIRTQKEGSLVLPRNPLTVLSNCWKIRLVVLRISVSEVQSLSLDESSQFFKSLKNNLTTLELASCYFLDRDFRIRLADLKTQSLRNLGLQVGNRDVIVSEGLEFPFVKRFQLTDVKDLIVMRDQRYFEISSKYLKFFALLFYNKDKFNIQRYLKNIVHLRYMPDEWVVESKEIVTMGETKSNPVFAFERSKFSKQNTYWFDTPREPQRRL
jgi:hypothetical protein